MLVSSSVVGAQVDVKKVHRRKPRAAGKVACATAVTFAAHNDEPDG